MSLLLRRFTLGTGAMLVFSIGLIANSSAVSAASSCASLPAQGALQITAPQDYEVFQRSAHNNALVTVQGQYTSSASTRIQIVTLKSDGSVLKTVSATHALGQTTFSIAISLPTGGWYQMVVKELDNKGTVIAQSQINHVGVGEVFLTAGQSNATLSGQTRQPSGSLTSGAILGSCSLGWMSQVDFPDAGGFGTVWPVLATKLSTALNMPVGIIEVACGGTSVAQWLPMGSADAIAAPSCGADDAIPGGLYQRLIRATQFAGGVRAVLWDQGENDEIANTSQAVYQSRLTTIITQYRSDIGTSTPWLVANASYFPGSETNQANCTFTGPINYASMGPIRRAQQALWAEGVAKPGPDTDGFIGAPYRYPGQYGYCVHFADQGEKIIGDMWYVAVKNAKLFPIPTFITTAPVTTSATLTTAAVAAATVQSVYMYSSGFDHLLSLSLASSSVPVGYALQGKAFKTYIAPPSDAPVLLSRCLFIGKDHFVSARSDCELQGSDASSTIGYASADPQAPDTVPLYRFVSLSTPGSADILSTTNLDAAFSAGYKYQFVEAFVPK